MGAQSFYNKSKGVSARDCFQDQMQLAKHEHGHGGYTGTIAEKSSYTNSRKPKEFDAENWIKLLEYFDEEENKENEHYYALKKDSEVYHNKWGDALCISTHDGYIFCGYASS
jgi:hypothetical protein